MNHHDVGRGRGGVAGGAGAGSRADARWSRASSSDRLYPLRLQQELGGAASRGAGGRRSIDSPSGHDGFLIEAATVSRLLGRLLDTPGPLS